MIAVFAFLENVAEDFVIFITDLSQKVFRDKLIIKRKSKNDNHSAIFRKFYFKSFKWGP